VLRLKACIDFHDAIETAHQKACANEKDKAESGLPDDQSAMEGMLRAAARGAAAALIHGKHRVNVGKTPRGHESKYQAGDQGCQEREASTAAFTGDGLGTNQIRREEPGRLLATPELRVPLRKGLHTERARALQ